MYTVTLSGWSAGFVINRLVAMLRRHGLGLGSAHQLAVQFVEGKPLSLNFDDRESATAFVEAARSLGADGTVRENSLAAMIERDTETGLLIGYVPGFAGAQTQAESLEELRDSLQDVVTALIEISGARPRTDPRDAPDAELIGTELVTVN